MTRVELQEFLAHVDSGAVVKGGSEHHRFMHDAAQDAFRITAELNSGYHDPDEVRALMGRLTRRPVDDSVTVFPPFHSEFGKNLHLGKNVFINLGCRFQDTGGIVMYQLNGMILSLFPQHELMEDARVKDASLGPSQGGKPCAPRFTLAQCLRSRADVDALFAELRRKKVTITKEPEKVFWGGYSGYFADPDGHLWEVAHNPFLEMDAAGNVTGMKQG